MTVIQEHSDMSRDEQESEEQEEEDGDEEIIEIPPNCLQKINNRLTTYMFDPNSKKMKFLIVSIFFTFQFDIFITSLLIGNYHFQTGQDQDYLGHQTIYFYINIIYIADIFSSFFKHTVIDPEDKEMFSTVAWRYFKVDFWLDIITILPYNEYQPNYIFFRFVRIRNFRKYQIQCFMYAEDFLSDYIDNELLKKMLDTMMMILLLILFSHFFACMWMLIGFYNFQYERGWLFQLYTAGNQVM